MLAEPAEITPKCLRAILSSGPPETLAETARECHHAALEFRLCSFKWEEKGKFAAQAVHENTLYFPKESNHSGR